MYEMLSISHCV